MIKRLIIIYFLFGQLISSYGQSKKINPPYTSKEFKFDSVVAYECKKNIKGAIISEGKLYTKLISKQKTLSPELLDSLNSFLRSTIKSEVNTTHVCWFSYLGIVYYYKGQFVANFNISDQCGSLLLYSRTLDSSNWSLTELYFKEYQRNKISWLCAKLGFVYR